MYHEIMPIHFQDSEEMFVLEAQVNQMLPLIDNELERVDRHHAKLTQLSTSLVEAINMYHLLMREADLKLGNIVRLPPSIYGQTEKMYSPFPNFAPVHQMGKLKLYFIIN